MGRGGGKRILFPRHRMCWKGPKREKKDSPLFYSLGSRSEQIRERRREKVDNLPPAIERPWRRDASLHKFNLRPRFFLPAPQERLRVRGRQITQNAASSSSSSPPHSPFPFKRKEDRRKMPVARASLFAVFLWTPRRLVFGCAHVFVHCAVQYARCTTYVYTILLPLLENAAAGKLLFCGTRSFPPPPLVFKKRRRNLHDANFFPAVKEDHVRTPPRLFPPPYPLSSRYRAGIFVFFLSLRRRWDHWASMRGRRIPHKTRARSTDKPPTSKQSFPLLSPSFLPPIQQ